MKRYPKYKDSGVEWIGEIPEGWDVKRLKHCSKFISGYAFSSDAYTDDGIPIIRIGDIKPDINLNETKKVPVEYVDSCKDFQIKYGDILLALTGATIGKTSVYLLNDMALLNQRVSIVRPEQQISNDFLKHIIDCHFFKRHIDYECSGGAQDNIGKPEVTNYLLFLPPSIEQQSIAKYLDHKTHQIDTLIEKKQKQIELLKEQRTAIINHAVTKGLNPNVKMKDSGIEWLGEIPAHWETTRLKFICSLLRDGTHLPPPRHPVGIPLLSVRNIVNGKFVNLPDDSLISEQDYLSLKKSFEVIENDVLLAIVGATLGKVAIVEKMLPFHIQRSLAVFRPLGQMMQFKYLSYFFQSSIFQNLLWRTVGFSAQPGIYLGTLSNFHITSPPIKEQGEIIEFLDKKTSSIEGLINKTNSELHLINEYRTSLISDAVTGKIDVRNEVPA